MSEKMRIRIEFDAQGNDEVCEPGDFLDCETEEHVMDRIVGWAEEEATLSAHPDRDDIAALWAAVQKLREREG